MCVVIALASGYAGGRKAGHKVMAQIRVTAEKRVNQGRGGRGEREDGLCSRDIHLLRG